MTARRPKIAPVAANETKALPIDASLVQCVQATVDALSITNADAALVGLAYTMARSIDGMDDDVRQRMIGQTSGGLLRVLQELRLHAPATPKPWSKWDDRKPGAVAARGIGGR